MGQNQGKLDSARWDMNTRSVATAVPPAITSQAGQAAPRVIASPGPDPFYHSPPRRRVGPHPVSSSSAPAAATAPPVSMSKPKVLVRSLSAKRRTARSSAQRQVDGEPLMARAKARNTLNGQVVREPVNGFQAFLPRAIQQNELSPPDLAVSAPTSTAWTCQSASAAYRPRSPSLPSPIISPKRAEREWRAKVAALSSGFDPATADVSWSASPMSACTDRRLMGPVPPRRVTPSSLPLAHGAIVSQPAAATDFYLSIEVSSSAGTSPGPLQVELDPLFATPLGKRSSTAVSNRSDRSPIHDTKEESALVGGMTTQIALAQDDATETSVRLIHEYQQSHSERNSSVCGAPSLNIDVHTDNQANQASRKADIPSPPLSPLSVYSVKNSDIIDSLPLLSHAECVIDCAKPARLRETTGSDPGLCTEVTKASEEEQTNNTAEIQVETDRLGRSATPAPTDCQVDPPAALAGSTPKQLHRRPTTATYSPATAYILNAPATSLEAATRDAHYAQLISTPRGKMGASDLAVFEDDTPVKSRHPFAVGSQPSPVKGMLFGYAKPDDAGEWSRRGTLPARSSLGDALMLRCSDQARSSGVLQPKAKLTPNIGPSPPADAALTESTRATSKTRHKQPRVAEQGKKETKKDSCVGSVNARRPPKSGLPIADLERWLADTAIAY
ncbi:hypothetical protein IAU60_004406 [Kwoniella sp. DSM 27419]